MAHRPLIIGITGSIGSGKSAVGALLSQRGALVIDADELAREVVLPGTPGLAEVVAHFGADIVEPSSGALNRAKLASIVFTDPAQRKILEGILHPKIRVLFQQKLAAATSSSQPYWLVAYLVPLLFESGYSYDELDLVVVVSATEELCIARVASRDGASAEQVKQRLAAQLPIAEKERRADFVIYNNGSTTELSAAVQALLVDLKQRHDSGNLSTQRSPQN